MSKADNTLNDRPAVREENQPVLRSPKPAHRIASLAWGCIFVLSILSLLGLFAYAMFRVPYMAVIVVVFSGVLALVLGNLAMIGERKAQLFKLEIKRRQEKVISYEELVKVDKRPPILYLRPFWYDGVHKALNEHSRTIPLPPYWEERLVGLMSEIGPVVALHKPRVTGPVLGAVRLKVDNHDWQKRIRELMREAALIGILMGEASDSLLWEVQSARELVRPERLLFFFNSDSEYTSFRRPALTLLNCSLPEEIPSHCGRYLAAILYFERDWSPHFVGPEGTEPEALKRWLKWRAGVASLREKFNSPNHAP